MLSNSTKIFFLTLIVINVIYSIVEIVKSKKSKGYEFPSDFYVKNEKVSIDDFSSWEINSKFLLNLTSREFEYFIASVYKKLGYDVVVTPASADGGKDIILKDDKGNKIYVECKRWHKKTGYTIGREICQKLIGAMAKDNVKKGIIVTTGEIHENAYEYKKELESNSNMKLQILNTNNIINLCNKALENSIKKAT